MHKTIIKILIRLAQYVDVDSGILEKGKLYWVSYTNFVTRTINAGIRSSA
jgi:hypothetical protein